MRKVLFLLSLVVCSGFKSVVVCSVSDDVECRSEIDGELDVDTLLEVEDLPASLLKPRQLPWYIDIISKPGAYIFFKACNFLDWIKDRQDYMKNVSRALLYRLHIRKQIS
jgi:hypothetical protein